MKRALALLFCVIFTFTLCGCSGIDSIKENLTKSGYTIDDMDENTISSLNDDVKYTYNGKGTVLRGFYGKGKNGETVSVVEFADRDDMTLMYKQIKSALEDGQTIDIKGKIVVYGTKSGVKTALK